MTEEGYSVYHNYQLHIIFSLFPIPYYLFPIPYYLFPIPYYLFPIPYYLFPAQGKCLIADLRGNL
ncbi:hypothetical protein [Moorena producens]|uniref:hypothetical protein n=1 Tax=Moorena producens TaxID=1155739 RepID=UPI0011EA69CE|nr:hypothetical protein [Moorena producens]